jgi:transcriptional regulator with XRE-family HTH domain
MNEPFSSLLQRLRTAAHLTNEALAKLADIPESLISGLQNDNRRIGEYQARKLGAALQLHGEDLEQFILQAINTCTEKVLEEAKPYPAHLLNLLAVQLHQAGIKAGDIGDFTIVGDPLEQKIILSLNGDRQATLTTQLALL